MLAKWIIIEIMKIIGQLKELLKDKQFACNAASRSVVTGFLTELAPIYYCTVKDIWHQ